MTLKEVAQEISRRLTRTFLPNEKGARPCHGEVEKYATDPHWRDLVLFNEYFHGETGRGLGASHQTGWTALAVKLLENAIDDPDRTETHASQGISEGEERTRGQSGVWSATENRARQPETGVNNRWPGYELSAAT